MSTATHSNTARAVAGLESALWAAGHEVTVPANPGVDVLDRLCRLIGVRPSQLMAAVERRDCPPWCGWHPEGDPASHNGVLHSAGGVSIGLCRNLGEDVVTIYPPDVDEGLTPARARALAAALTMAARMTDEGDQR